MRVETSAELQLTSGSAADLPFIRETIDRMRLDPEVPLIALLSC
jgi:hypothetical protein